MDGGDIRRSSEGAAFYSEGSDDIYGSKKTEKNKRVSKYFQGHSVSQVPVTRYIEAQAEGEILKKPISEYKASVIKECKWFEDYAISQVPVTRYTEKNSADIKIRKPIQAYKTQAAEQRVNNFSDSVSEDGSVEINRDKINLIVNTPLLDTNNKQSNAAFLRSEDIIDQVKSSNVNEIEENNIDQLMNLEITRVEEKINIPVESKIHNPKKNVWSGNGNVNLKTKKQESLKTSLKKRAAPQPPGYIHKPAQYCGKHDQLSSLTQILIDVDSSTKAKSSLTELFESKIGRSAFTSNDFPVDKDSLIDFIDSYKKAITMEAKENDTQRIPHRDEQKVKKEQRLLAIDEVKKFVNKLSPSDINYMNKCRSALQILGRIRERALVTQKNMPYCGGFSILKDAWGGNPLKMAKISIELLSSEDRTVTLDAITPGCKKIFKITPDFQINQFSEPCMDSQLIAALYDIDKEGSTCDLQDCLVARYLGFFPQKAISRDKFRTLFSKNSNGTNLYLDDMVKATRRKNSIHISIDSIMMDYLRKFHPLVNKRKMADVLNYDDLIKLLPYKDNLTKISDEKHAVTIEKIERGRIGLDNIVSLKLYTWGSMLNIQMTEEMFKEHFYFKDCAVINVEDKSFKCFEKLPDVVSYWSDSEGKAVVECADGKKLYFDIGEEISIGGSTYKIKNGNIICIPDPQNQVTKKIQAIWKNTKTKIKKSLK